MKISRTVLEAMKVSFFMHFSMSKKEDMYIGRVFNGIRNEAYAEKITEARSFLSQGNKDKYKSIKESLPVITFSGTFLNAHKTDECTHYNSLLVIDIDKLNDWEMDTTAEILSNDPYIASFWISPSGKGFKGLVHLAYDVDVTPSNLSELHCLGFRKFFTYLLTRYDLELDKSGKDVPRLCFMCSDSSICVKEEAEVFEVHLDGEELCSKPNCSERKTVSSSTLKKWSDIINHSAVYENHNHNKALIIYILKKLRKRHLTITETWEDWTKVAFAMASSVHPVSGRKLFLEFCRLDKENHNEELSDRLIQDAYSRTMNRCSIKSIIYLARQKGIILDR